MRRTAAIWVLVVAMLGARAGAAQEVPRAEQLFRDGVRALHGHDYEQARTLFEQSFALAPRGSVLLDLAKAEWALGRHVDAIKHLRAALERSDLPAANREPTQRGLARWSAAMGHIVVNTDAGASVRMDAMPVEGNAPLAGPVDVEPGVRVVETRLGELSGRVEVEAKEGVVVEADAFVVHPAPTSAPSVTRIELSPPVRNQPLPSPGIGTPRPPDSFWNTRRAVGVGMAGAGVVSMVVGSVFFASASRDESRATAAALGLGPFGCAGEMRPAACSAQDTAVSAERADGTISRVAMGLGIASIVVGTTAILWPSTSARNVGIAGTLRPNGGELDLQGRF
jgi:hypothetical protein